MFRFTPSRPLLPSSFNQEQTHAHTRITTESGSRSRRFSSRLATTKLDLTRPLHLFSLIIDRHFLRFHLLQNVKCSSFRPVNSAPIRQLKKEWHDSGCPLAPLLDSHFPQIHIFLWPPRTIICRQHISAAIHSYSGATGSNPPTNCHPKGKRSTVFVCHF